MQLQVQQPNLADVFGPDSLYRTLYGGQQIDQANANAQQNLGEAQQEQAFQADLHPYEVQQAGANVAHTNAMTGLANAQIPGEQAMSGLKQLDLGDEQSIPQDVRSKAAVYKKLASISDDQFKDLANHIQMNMSSPDPSTRAQAMDAWSHLPNVALERMKLAQEGDNSARVAGINSGAMLQAQKMQIDAGKYDKYSKESLIMQALSGNYQKQSGGWTMLSMDASARGDEASAQKYAQLADLAKQADSNHQAQAAYTRLAGTVDLNGLGMKTVAQPGAVQPVQTPTAAVTVPNGMAPIPGPTDTGSVIMKDRNGTVHKVPSDKVDQALKFGWTK